MIFSQEIQELFVAVSKLSRSVMIIYVIIAAVWIVMIGNIVLLRVVALTNRDLLRIIKSLSTEVDKLKARAEQTERWNWRQAEQRGEL